MGDRVSGLDLKAVHEALADQIRDGIDDATGFTVKAFPSTSPRPAIEVWPDADYISFFETSGPTGLADVQLVIRIFLSAANPETEWLQVCRLLSAGTGFDSSIVDAVMADRTLGGAVADTFIGDARWEPDDGAIDVPVQIQLNKVGAQT